MSAAQLYWKPGKPLGIMLTGYCIQCILHPNVVHFGPLQNHFQEKLLITCDSAIRLQGSNQTRDGKWRSGVTTSYGLAEGAREDGQGVCINICPLGGTGTAHLFYTSSLWQITFPGFVTNGLGCIWAGMEVLDAIISPKSFPPPNSVYFGTIS